MSNNSFVLRDVQVPKKDSGTETVDVAVEAGVITFVGKGFPGREGVQEMACHGEKLLFPGMLNGHTHSSEMWNRAAIRPFPLELWLCELIDYSPNDPEMIYLAALHCGIETLLSGGTCIMDHLSLIEGKEIEGVQQAVKAYEELGIRAFVAPLMGDYDTEYCISREAPQPSGEQSRFIPPRDSNRTEALLHVLRESVEEVHGKGHEGQQRDPAGNLLVQMGVGPTGVQLASKELYEGCIEISSKYNLVRHTHLLETKAQKELSYERFGTTAVEFLNSIGFLNEKTTCAHSIWLEDDDMPIIAKTGSTIVHNALSNIRLGSGIAPVLKYVAHGINVAFGCDGAASNDGQDLLEAVKIGSFIHNITDPDYRHWLTPQQSLHMATKGGYEGVGLGRVAGEIAVGQHADMVLYDLNNLSLLPKTDPVALVLWGGRTSGAVDCVWVAGRQLVSNGKITTIDMDKFQAKLKEKSQWSSQPRPSELVNVLEENYRKVMQINE